MMVTPPRPSGFVVARARPGVAGDVEGCRGSDRIDGDIRLFCDIFPGTPYVDGMRFKRGRSVGGLGAGPGFMNWSAP